VPGASCQLPVGGAGGRCRMPDAGAGGRWLPMPDSGAGGRKTKNVYYKLVWCTVINMIEYN